jgi:hypothetical protein
MRSTRGHGWISSSAVYARISTATHSKGLSELTLPEASDQQDFDEVRREFGTWCDLDALARRARL